MTDSNDDKKGTYTYEYPRPAVTTDCVIFSFDGKDLNVLLIQRGIEPYKGSWAFPGGFLRMDETCEEGALRELKEETGLVPEYIEQFHTFSDVNRDPRGRVITIAFYALIKKSEVCGGDDAKDARWFKIKDIPHLAFDHDYVLRIAQQTLKEKIHFQPVGFELMENEFTLPELQRLYEAILEVKFDRRNFQKKMLQIGLIEDVSYLDEDDRVRFSVCNPWLPEELSMKPIDCLFEERKILESYITPVSANSASAAEVSRKASAGRPGKKYRFNKKQYDELKESGKFKLEW